MASETSQLSDSSIVIIQGTVALYTVTTRCHTYFAVTLKYTEDSSLWGKVMFSQACVILFTGGRVHPEVFTPVKVCTPNRPTGGRYAFSWNASLLVKIFVILKGKSFFRTILLRLDNSIKIEPKLKQQNFNHNFPHLNCNSEVFANGSDTGQN